MVNKEDSKMEKAKTIINEWDPIGLLGHAPNDEYEVEIAVIREALKVGLNAQELAKEIQKAFIKQFGDDVFKKSYDECLIIAKRILA